MIFFTPYWVSRARGKSNFLACEASNRGGDCLDGGDGGDGDYDGDGDGVDGGGSSLCLQLSTTGP